MLAKTVAIILEFLPYAMLGRVLLPIFFDEGSGICLFFAVITEPFIAPTRLLMEKFNILQGTPIDWSFTASYLIIIIVSGFLPAL